MRVWRVSLAIFLGLGGALFAAPYAQGTEQGLNVESFIFNSAFLPEHEALPEYQKCKEIYPDAWISVNNINHNFDAEYQGIVAGCQSDFVMVHYYGYMTWPETETIQLLSWADDGFYLTLDGETVINDWYLKGCSGSLVEHSFEANVPQRLDAWFYEYGGGACNVLGQVKDGQWIPLPDSVFTKVIPVVEPPKPVLLPPVNITYVVEGTTINLVWETPETETAIEHYALFYTYGDNAGWAISVFGNTAEITGLPENTPIQIRLRSDNDTLPLYSEYSEPLIIQTGTNPVVPPVEPPDPPVEPEPEPEPSPENTPDVNPTVEPKPTPSEEPYVPAPTSGIGELDPDTIEPSSLSDGEVAALIAYANEILEEAEQGSPEYELALEQLFVAAQADDIIVDETIAAIPLIGNATVALIDAVNFMGNVGADMAPQVREKAKKTLVSAVIVTQIAVQASGLAAQTAISNAAAFRRP